MVADGFFIVSILSNKKDEQGNTCKCEEYYQFEINVPGVKDCQDSGQRRGKSKPSEQVSFFIKSLEIHFEFEDLQGIKF
jgi:hypothetical protein